MAQDEIIALVFLTPIALLMWADVIWAIYKLIREEIH